MAYLEKLKYLNRTLSILLIYIVAMVLGAGFIVGLWPSLREQLVNLVENAPDLLNALSLQLKELEQNGAIQALFPNDSTPLSQVTDYVNKGFTFVTNYVSGFISLVSSFAIILFTFPIILFYMLKQDKLFGRKLVNIAPKRFQKDSREVVLEIDQALSGFIVGRVLVNLALGVLMYIGFLLIGLPYALLLTVVAVILNFIPFIGAIVSSIPIVIMGLVVSPSVAIWSLVIILVSQQIQDNLVAPYVFGKTGYSPADDDYSCFGCWRSRRNHWHSHYYSRLYDCENIAGSNLSDVFQRKVAKCLAPFQGEPGEENATVRKPW